MMARGAYRTTAPLAALSKRLLWTTTRARSPGSGSTASRPCLDRVEPAATMRAGDGESCPAHPDWSPAAPRPTLPPTGRLLSSDLSGIRDRSAARPLLAPARRRKAVLWSALRSEEHTSELQSRENLVCLP